MTTTTRQVISGNAIVLEVDVRDATGQRADADTLPSVEIIDSQGNIQRAMSSTVVMRIDEGRYRTTFQTGSTGPSGIWIDHWRATVNGFTTSSRLNFIVLDAGADIGIAGDQIGDDARISYTDEEIRGINILLSCLKARLKNNLEVEGIDGYGNTTFTDCFVFTDDELVWFLRCSLSEFNQTPHFTDFTFNMVSVVSTV
jgi:hypothetical protein